MTKPVINIADVPLRDNGHGERVRGEDRKLRPDDRLDRIGAMYAVVPPGKRAFPFHIHHGLHELFVILEGTGEYRFGDETYPVKARRLRGPAGGPTSRTSCHRRTELDLGRRSGPSSFEVRCHLAQLLGDSRATTAADRRREPSKRRGRIVLGR